MRHCILRLFALAGVWSAAPVLAHHSPIIFDANTIVVIEGEITRFDWMNPHTYIFVKATNAAGENQEWQFESDATPILSRNGWSPSSLVPGERVLVRANPDRHAARAHALLISIDRCSVLRAQSRAGRQCSRRLPV